MKVPESVIDVIKGQIEWGTKEEYILLELKRKMNEAIKAYEIEKERKAKTLQKLKEMKDWLNSLKDQPND